MENVSNYGYQLTITWGYIIALSNKLSTADTSSQQLMTGIIKIFVREQAEPS